jgi:hypothetical protein
MKQVLGWVMLAAAALWAAGVVYLALTAEHPWAATLGGSGFLFGLVVVGARWAFGHSPPSRVPAADTGSQEGPPGRGDPDVSFTEADLSRLTAAGWGLLALTAAAVVAFAFAFVGLSADADKTLDDPLGRALLGLGGLGVVVGVFQAGRFLLRRLGVAMFR